MSERLRREYDLHCVAIHLCYEVLAMREALEIWKRSGDDVVYRLALENLIRLFSGNLPKENRRFFAMLEG